MREIKTREEIRTEIVRLFQARIAVLGGVDFSSIGYPWRLVEPDHDGCNWHIAYFTKTKWHRAEIVLAVGEVRSRWNLE